jgi:2-C-methyl-D-erythritol 4-phosphate cytidylyltransferase
MIMYQNRKIGLIYLSGGQGLRFGGSTPKQYLQLKEKPLALHAFHVFQAAEEIDDFVVVCAPEFQKMFLDVACRPILFAQPGLRRQDSVEKGFKQLSSHVDLVAIHDSARPFSTTKMLLNVLDAADRFGAAAVGMPIKYTLKDCDENGMVLQTPERSRFREIQTPQALRYEILKEGLVKSGQDQITVTDDTSLAELVGSTVKIVEGSYHNIKITTPEDMLIAEQFEAVNHVHL